MIGGSLRVLGALHQISVQNISPGYFYRAQKHLPHRFSWLCTEDRKLGGGGLSFDNVHFVSHIDVLVGLQRFGIFSKPRV